MNSSRLLFSRLFLFLCLVTTFFPYFGRRANAAGPIKTITVVFDSAPSSYTVSKLPLRYGKKFAYSWTFDDGLIEGYRNAYRYMTGGIVDVENKTIYPGLYSTDGAGNLVSFGGSFAFYGVNNSFVDLHYDTTGNISYGELRRAYDNNWDVLNHGWTSRSTPNPADTIINYPAPHGPSTIDYQYEVEKLNEVVKEKLNITPNTSILALPSGDQLYIDGAWASGIIKSVISQATSFTYGGSAHPLPNGANPVDVNTLISNPTGLDQYLMYRNSVSSPSATPDTTPDATYATLVNNLNSGSGSGVNLWAHAFTHRIWCGTTGCGNAGLISGANMYWPKFKALMDYVYTTYGAAGNDTVWMAGQQEVYEYLQTVKNTDVSTSLVGNTLTITLDTTDVPSYMRRKDLSLQITANTNISSISYGEGDFNAHTENTATGLINVSMGETYVTDLQTKVERYVAIAEKTLLSTDKTVASTWVGFLPNGSVKTAFENRLSVLGSPLRTFQITFGEGATSAAAWNRHSRLLTSDAALTNMLDSTGASSTLALRVTSNFNSKFDGSTEKGQSTNNDTGVFLDTYMRTGMAVSTNGATGTIQFYNLDTSKRYTLKVFGSNIGRNTGVNSKMITRYRAIGTTTQTSDLQTFQNVEDSAIFQNMTPDTDGTIELEVKQYDTNGGYGFLNAVALIEVNANATPSTPSSLGGATLVDGSTTSDNTPTVSFTLADTDLVDTLKYQIQIDDSADFSSPVVDYTSALAVQGSKSFTVGQAAGSGSYTTGSVSQTLSDGSYYWRVRAIDPSNAQSAYTVARSGSIAFVVDTTSPLISSVLVTPASESALITWQTNEASSSQVDYGISTAYGSQTILDSTPVTSHSVSVSGLVACSTYYYRVRSRDSVSNTALGTGGTFTTGGCTGDAPVSDQTDEVIDKDVGGIVDLRSAGFGIAIDVPAGFASSDANFQIQKLDKTSVVTVLSIPSGQVSVGDYFYDLTALSGVSTVISDFDEDVTITLYYDAADLPADINESTLKIYRNDGVSWEALSNCSVNTTLRTVTCDTPGFSIFSLFGSLIVSSPSVAYAAPAILPMYPASSDGEALGFEVKADSQGVVTLSMNASPETTSGYVVSLDPEFKNEGIKPYISKTAHYVVPHVSGNTTIYLRYYSITGHRSPVFTKTISLSGTSAANTSVSQPVTITRTLRKGMSVSDVKTLQQYLNTNGFPVASSGPGSLGKETAYFGSATERAVKAFQKARKVIPVSGVVGPLTRAAMQKVQ